MKARKVKGLDPDGSFAGNARRIAGVRLAELCDLAPRALDPAKPKKLHDMRIAAKLLRYVLEISRPALGPGAGDGVRTAKALALHLAARREVLFARFTREWARLEARDFPAALLTSISEPKPATTTPTAPAES
ncbi:MAG: CHAD domain-containing protein [Thermoleophilaceae bacterium]